jgi:hypothetical protein
VPKYRNNFNQLKQSGSLTVCVLHISHNVDCCILSCIINYRLIHIYVSNSSQQYRFISWVQHDKTVFCKYEVQCNAGGSVRLSEHSCHVNHLMRLLAWESFIEFSRHISVTSAFNLVSSWAFKGSDISSTPYRSWAQSKSYTMPSYESKKKLYWRAFICSLLPYRNVASASNTQMETSVDTLAINNNYNFTLLHNTWIFAILFCMFWSLSEFLYSSQQIQSSASIWVNQKG